MKYQLTLDLDKANAKKLRDAIGDVWLENEQDKLKKELLSIHCAQDDGSFYDSFWKNNAMELKAMPVNPGIYILKHH